MRFNKTDHYRTLSLIIGCVSLFILQSFWFFRAYQMQDRQVRSQIEDAFHLAYQKEQTYRVPVVDIVNSGGVTIQSCESEEITVVQECHGDTITYTNMSGYSIIDFLNKAFRDLRENMVPMNIYCLADLFGGMLHDKNIAASFVIERYNISTGELIETSQLQTEKRLEMKPENTLTVEISDAEAVRAIIQITPGVIIGSMLNILIWTTLLFLSSIICLVLLFLQKKSSPRQEILHPFPVLHNIFPIGKFEFDPDKNELRGFGETIQLNKKENAILYALCVQHGNIVERNALLEENWGDSGMIYSRSLDTYLTTLRKYLKKDPSIQIITVKGVGYKLVLSE